MNPQITRAAEVQIKNNVITLINDLALKLFKNDVFPGLDANDGDFVEPTDSGYEQAIVDNWQQIGYDQHGRLVLQEELVTWTFTHNAGNFTIYGYWYFSSGNDFTWSYTRLETPVAITQEGQTFSVRPTIRIGGLGSDG